MSYNYRNPTFVEVYPQYDNMRDNVFNRLVIARQASTLGYEALHYLLRNAFRYYEMKYPAPIDDLGNKDYSIIHDNMIVFFDTYYNEFVIKWEHCLEYIPTEEEVTLLSKAVQTTDPQNLEQDASDLDYITSQSKAYNNKIAMINAIELKNGVDKFFDLFAEHNLAGIGGYSG